ncbi:hypothetical protein GY45DRAFT_1374552 [Cubamyces sp. BRFM 1775]|nr:hypothetical protein GY45DRAFT_1374552 [Cubamyces sp. BRFM 1775]
MPSINYQRRVRTVLSTVAKNDQNTILLLDLVDRVKDSIILEGEGRRAGPRAEYFVQKALKRECLAARVKIVRDRNENLVVNLSPSGFRYFQHLDIVVVLDHRESKFRKLTVDQLQKETQILEGILDEVLKVIRIRRDRYAATAAIERLPGIVTEIVGTVERLEEQYTDLNSILAEHRRVERAL